MMKGPMDRCISQKMMVGRLREKVEAKDVELLELTA